MKNVFKYKLILLAVVFFIGSTATAQTTPTAANGWAKKGEWRNGLKLKLYTGNDNVEFARQYKQNKALWDKAFAFIKNIKLDTLTPGKHLIAGEDLFVNVTDADSKDFDKSSWESHRNYIDIHLMVTGKEKIGVMNPAGAKVTNAYNATKDLINYDPATSGTYYIADTETLFIFFPKNAHRPNIRVDGYNSVKKIVVKIKMAQ